MSKVGKLLKIVSASLLLFCPISQQAIAQETTDAAAIFEAGISKKFYKTLQISLDEEIRTSDFVDKLDRLSTGVKITYNLPRFKNLKFGVGYVLLSYFEENRIEENRHRFLAHVQYNYSYAGFDFSLRSRFQSTLRDENVGSYKINPKNKWKNRFEVVRGIYGTPYKPYASVEMSNTIGNIDGDYIDRMRYRVGCEYRINRQQALDLFVRYSTDLNVKAPENIFAVGIGYKYKL